VAFPASVNCLTITSGRSSGEKEEVYKCNPEPVPYLKLACLIWNVRFQLPAVNDRFLLKIVMCTQVVKEHLTFYLFIIFAHLSATCKIFIFVVFWGFWYMSFSWTYHLSPMIASKIVNNGLTVNGKYVTLFFHMNYSAENWYFFASDANVWVHSSTCPEWVVCSYNLLWN
jgi:hypothetical protein